MNNINFAFLGATQFSKEILTALIENNFKPKAVFTIPEFFDISYSKNEKVRNFNYASLEDICLSHGIPLHYIDSSNKKIADYEDFFTTLKLDVILVMGWYYMVPESIRKHSKYGAWGIHGSLLPNYAGGAPLVWAMINGEKETGVTLFKLDNGVDNGDIIAQKVFSIDEDDTIKEVYQKATNLSKKILIDALNNIDGIDFIPQDQHAIKIYPQRKPDDGELDLSLSASQLYNFIRAQSPPYPGAFLRTSDGKKLIIEKARIKD